MSKKLFAFALAALIICGTFIASTSQAGIYFVATRSATVAVADSNGDVRTVFATFFITAPGRDDAATAYLDEQTAKNVVGRNAYKLQFARMAWDQVPLEHLDAVRAILADDIGRQLVAKFGEAGVVLEEVEIEAWQDAAYCHI